MHLRFITFITSLALVGGSALAQSVYDPPPQTEIPERLRASIAPTPWTMPIYEGAIPNSTGAPDEERQGHFWGWPFEEKVSHPTITAYLPATDKSIGSAILIFPGGGYTGEGLPIESEQIATLFQGRGVAAFVVKYRLPSDVTMKDKSIGPLQDAQQSIRLLREHAAQWGINPSKVGVIGFSAGGHLASSAGTHFAKSYIPNENNVNLRPDFEILVYPVISMTKGLMNKGSHDALLGKDPPESLVHLFSNEEQVTGDTPPTLLLHAEDDTTVDVDNSISYFESLRRHKVPAHLIIFPKGGHGFFPMPRDEWLQPTFAWMTRNGWMKP